MPERTAEPLSPELILVAPPEEAALAREQLPALPEPPRARRTEPDPGPVNGSSAVDWDEFLADVRSRPVEPIAPPRIRPPVPVRPNGRKRLVVAGAALLAVAIVVGLAWARDRTQQNPASSSASSKPAAPHHQVTTAKPAAHAKTTPAHGATTATKPKAKAASKPKPAKSKPRARRAAGFVPTRVWSWAAVPGSRAYVVRFLRNGNKVLKIRAGAPRIALPAGFSFAPGRYRWTVTALPRKGGSGRVIVNSSFTVTAPNG